jgi:hypothetical protein
MGNPPYRAMPLPPGPPREWRPIVERGLAVFNGLILVASIFTECVPGPSRWFGWFLCAALTLALYGFLSHAPRRQRAFAVVPSALLWLLSGIVFMARAVLVHRFEDLYRLPNPPDLRLPPNPPPWWPPSVLFAFGLLFSAAGALTVEFTVARLRCE